MTTYGPSKSSCFKIVLREDKGIEYIYTFLIIKTITETSWHTGKIRAHKLHISSAIFSLKIIKGLNNFHIHLIIQYYVWPYPFSPHVAHVQTSGRAEEGGRG